MISGGSSLSLPSLCLLSPTCLGDATVQLERKKIAPEGRMNRKRNGIAAT
ncbi:hypothetical protein BT93_F3369 [Corymbia citriodora subsp. variegata]|nr:hypothetical protein BT93_F3369 [Corymbia citriodora subsp. variegata]